MNTENEATNPVEDDTVVSEGVAEEAHAQGDDSTDTTDPTEPEEGDEDTPEDEAEIELDGAKYRVPKAIEQAILRQADYTRKTQEIAEHRRAVEAERAALVTAAEAQKALLSDHVRVTQLEQTVAYYSDVDWDRADEENPDVAAREWRKYQQAQNDLASAKSTLETKQTERLKAEQAQVAKALQETSAELQRTIPGWNRDLAVKLMENATKAYGVSHEELAQATDAASWRMLHDLYLFQQQKTKQATTARAQQAATTAPIKKVGSKAPPPSPLSDRASTEAWMRARNDAVRKGR